MNGSWKEENLRFLEKQMRWERARLEQSEAAAASLLAIIADEKKHGPVAYTREVFAVLQAAGGFVPDIGACLGSPFNRSAWGVANAVKQPVWYSGTIEPAGSPALAIVHHLSGRVRVHCVLDNNKLLFDDVVCVPRDAIKRERHPVNVYVNEIAAFLLRRHSLLHCDCACLHGLCRERCKELGVNPDGEGVRNGGHCPLDTRSHLLTVGHNKLHPFTQSLEDISKEVCIRDLFSVPGLVLALEQDLRFTFIHEGSDPRAWSLQFTRAPVRNRRELVSWIELHAGTGVCEDECAALYNGARGDLAEAVKNGQLFGVGGGVFPSLRGQFGGAVDDDITALWSACSPCSLTGTGIASRVSSMRLEQELRAHGLVPTQEASPVALPCSFGAAGGSRGKHAKWRRDNQAFVLDDHAVAGVKSATKKRMFLDLEHTKESYVQGIKRCERVLDEKKGSRVCDRERALEAVKGQNKEQEENVYSLPRPKRRQRECKRARVSTSSSGLRKQGEFQKHRRRRQAQKQRRKEHKDTWSLLNMENKSGSAETTGVTHTASGGRRRRAGRSQTTKEGAKGGGIAEPVVVAATCVEVVVEKGAHCVGRGSDVASFSWFFNETTAKAYLALVHVFSFSPFSR